MISNRPLPWLAVSLFACTGIISCNRTSSADMAAAELKLSDKEVQIEDLKSEVEKLKAAAEETKKAGQKADATLQELNDSKRENKTLKEETEELRKEIEKLKDQITAKIRNRAVGEKFARVSAPNGKVYLQVVIRKVDDTGVSIAHDGGFSTLNEDTAPATWVERFRLGARKSEEPDPDEAAVAAAAAEKGGKPQKYAAVRSKLPGVLFIESGKTKGIAFVANRDGSTWLYTAAHLLATGAGLAVKDSKGAPFADFGKCEIAEDGDLARIEVSVKPEIPLAVVKPGGAAVDQDVVAVGSAGSGTPPLFGGKIDALKPKEIEVPSAITGGNSGGPVMLAETGEVIGVVCRAEAGRQDVWTPGVDVSKNRRLVTRIDREVPWRAASLESLRTETQRIAIFDSRSRLLFAVAALKPAQDGLQLDAQVGAGKGRQTILGIFQQHSKLAPVQQLVQMDKQLSEKALRSSERDMKRRVSGLYRDLLNAVDNDAAGFRAADFSYINRKEAELSVKWRKQATEMLVASAAALNR